MIGAKCLANRRPRFRYLFRLSEPLVGRFASGTLHDGGRRVTAQLPASHTRIAPAAVGLSTWHRRWPTLHDARESLPTLVDGAAFLVSLPQWMVDELGLIKRRDRQEDPEWQT